MALVNVAPPKFIRGALPLIKGRPVKFVWLTDVHAPYHIKMEHIFRFIKEFKPDYILLTGDIVNNDPYNHWESGSPGKARDLPTASSYYERCNRDFFRPLVAACPTATRVYWKGNHERWSDNAEAEFPSERGRLGVEHHLEGIHAWVDSFDLANLGRLHFVHGEECATGENHAKRMVEVYRRDVRYGHRHDVQEFSFRSPVDTKESYTARCGGTLCDFRRIPFDFMKKRPQRWQNSFSYGWVAPDRSFTDVIVRVGASGQFIAEGKRYG
jgi:predicted phosphodiesterase